MTDTESRAQGGDGDGECISDERLAELRRLFDGHTEYPRGHTHHAGIVNECLDAIHELAVENERLRDAAKDSGLPCVLFDDDDHDCFTYGSRGGPCVNYYLCTALGTQSTTDSDLPEGAVVCPECHGEGFVDEIGGQHWGGGDVPGTVDCPTCNGTGRVCEVCGGAVGEPKENKHFAIYVGERMDGHPISDADYHKEKA